MGLEWLSSFDDGSSMTDIVKVNGRYMRERGVEKLEKVGEREKNNIIMNKIKFLMKIKVE